MGKIGTKETFKTWLSVNKKMTYTKYTSLSIEKKNEIQKEYSKK